MVASQIPHPILSGGIPFAAVEARVPQTELRKRIHTGILWEEGSRSQDQITALAFLFSLDLTYVCKLFGGKAETCSKQIRWFEGMLAQATLMGLKPNFRASERVLQRRPS
jgi:hypothetical protein